MADIKILNLESGIIWAFCGRFSTINWKIILESDSTEEKHG